MTEPSSDQEVAEWWPRIYRMALALCGNEADAEDLAQETVVAGLESIGRFRGESSLSTWLYAILVHKYRDRRNRKIIPLRQQGRDMDTEHALALLRDLPSPLRITAALYYVEDMTVEQISEALGIPPATTRWRLHRSRETLRRRLVSSVLEKEA